MDALWQLPSVAWGRVVGAAAATRLPRPVVRACVSVYGHVLGVAMEEALVPERGYASFGDFFARRLRPEARPVDSAAEALVAPCDGELLAAGTLESDLSKPTFDVKGRRYSVTELVGRTLADPPSGSRWRYAIIYLSPADYHRVHCPVDGTVRSVRRIPGTRLPVNPFFSPLAPQAIVTNERVVFELTHADGEAVVVMVGAFGVSSITVTLERTDWPEERGGAQGWDVSRGDELGAFNVGSTVVALWTGGPSIDVQPGTRLLMGQRLAGR